MADARYTTPEYRAARKAYTRAQREGQWLECVQPVCVMRTRRIAPDQPVDVAHDDSGTMILGPAHSKCNRVDGGVRRHNPTARTASHSSGRGRSGGTLAKRECVVCGSTYTPTYSRQATCGRACGGQMRSQGIVPAVIPAKVTKRCPLCSIHFPHDGTPRIYCENCTIPSKRRARVADSRVCEVCDAAFDQHGPGRRRRFCPTCSPPGSYLDLSRFAARREVL